MLFIKAIVHPRKIINGCLTEISRMLMKRRKLSLALFMSPKIKKRKILKALKKNQKKTKSHEISMFNGKRIAIVGPAYDHESIENLSAYDLVARIGYTGKNSMYIHDKDICNVSFLAQWHAELLAKNISEIKSELQGITFFLRDDVKNIDKVRLSRELKCVDFCVKEITEIFGRVVPNFGVQVIYFLLSQNPKEIYVTNMDLNSSLLRPINYATNKVIFRENNQSKHLKSTMKNSFVDHHNPFTNFSFFNAIKSMTVVKFSNKLDYIILNGIKEYKNKINELYFQ
jgi:hypothetical protein